MSTIGSWDQEYHPLCREHTEVHRGQEEEEVDLSPSLWAQSYLGED